MRKLDLALTGGLHLDVARNNQSGFHLTEILSQHEHHLKFSLLGLLEGRTIESIDGLKVVTFFIVSGHVRIDAGPQTWDAGAGTFLEAPVQSYRLHGLKDSVLLCTADSRSEPKQAGLAGMRFIDRPVESWSTPSNW